MSPPPEVNPFAVTAHSSRAASESAPALPRGASVGRYLIVDAIGAGGMGVVYAAYDPKLDRKVAIKALHDFGESERDSAGQGRLLREAQAMAKLAHPNVVTVYDVVVLDGHVLLAMELVTGQSLRQWLRAERRSWRAIVGAFVQAGRGLAAAHAAGVVHRDFKLDNVLVGDDGRVRVGDFGLARSAGAPGEHATVEDGAVGLAATVTQDGALVGTPAYMAPAQLRGAASDALSDQFSFCASLYEALYGAPPFEATTLFELARAMDAERVRPPPPDAAVPAWVRDVAMRGLRASPELRFPSMEELLAALERDPSRARPRRIAAIAAAALAGVIAIAVGAQRREAQRACDARARGIDGAWGEAQRRAMRDAFVATRRPYADDTFAKTAAALDAYAAAWSEAEGDACRAAPRAPDEASAARERCLDARLGDARSLVAVLARTDAADGDAVDRAVQAVRALPSIASCASGDARAWPDDPALRAEAQAIGAKMSDASALRAAGRYAEAVPIATKNADDAERLGFRPLIADAILARAEAERDAGHLEAAAASFHRATLAAERAGAASDAAMAWIAEASLAEDHGDFARADDAFEHAAVWIDRTGGDPLLEARLDLARGNRLGDEGRFEDARPLHEKALAIFERLGRDEATLAVNGIGIDADGLGDYDEARRRYEDARARYERALGPEHPLVARELNNLGVMEADEGRYPEALVALDRALGVRARALGPRHPDTIVSEYNLALTYDGARRFADALPLAQRAVDDATATFGATSNDTAFALGAECEALVGVGRAGDAIPICERALDVRKAVDAAPINLADAQADLGRALVTASRDASRARALLSDARDSFVKAKHTIRIDEIDEALAKLK